MNKTWSDGIIAAHEPYLVTVHGGALLLWDRRTPEPFAVSREPYVRTMIILAENQQVSGESSFVGFFFEIHFLCLSSVCFLRIKSWVSLYWQLPQPTVQRAFSLTWPYLEE